MAALPIPLAEINRLSRADFLARFGDIAEHSPWVAEIAEKARPYGDRASMIAAFQAAVEAAGPQAQRELLLAHPDLAGRAAITGDLTADSRREQAGAGLDRLTREEFARFTAMNAEYRQRHGIPFIFAVRGATKHDILAGFAERLGNDPETEFRTALEQVQRIIRFRLEDRVAP
jgi:2-oxo-4-hydroxy-4-carboxy-5-ureidoimidazoline decarboxylase